MLNSVSFSIFFKNEIYQPNKMRDGHRLVYEIDIRRSMWPTNMAWPETVLSACGFALVWLLEEQTGALGCDRGASAVEWCTETLFNGSFPAAVGRCLYSSSSGSTCAPPPSSLTGCLTNWLTHRTVSNKLSEFSNLSLFCFFSLVTTPPPLRPALF